MQFPTVNREYTPTMHEIKSGEINQDLQSMLGAAVLLEGPLVPIHHAILYKSGSHEHARKLGNEDIQDRIARLRILGTIAFMAPEATSKRHFGYAASILAVGDPDEWQSSKEQEEVASAIFHIGSFDKVYKFRGIAKPATPVRDDYEFQRQLLHGNKAAKIIPYALREHANIALGLTMKLFDKSNPDISSADRDSANEEITAQLAHINDARATGMIAHLGESLTYKQLARYGAELTDARSHGFNWSS